MAAEIKLCECGCGLPTKVNRVTSRTRGWVRGEPRRFLQGHHNRVRSPETRERISQSLSGRSLREEHRRAISRAMLNGRSGTMSPEGRERLIAAKTGSKNAAWKGDAVTYSALHYWVRDHKTKTGRCKACGKEGRPTEWANISGEYHRDLDDFEEQCRSCNIKGDYQRRRQVGR